MKKLILTLFLCSSISAMKKDQTVGTLLLTGSYYCVFASCMQKYETHLPEADRQRRKYAYLTTAGLLGASGLVKLSRSLINHHNPIQTLGKFNIGAMSMASGLYLFTKAKFFYDEYKKTGDKFYEQQMNKCMCAGLLFTSFGSGLVTCGITDFPK